MALSFISKIGNDLHEIMMTGVNNCIKFVPENC